MILPQYRLPGAATWRTSLNIFVCETCSAGWCFFSGLSEMDG
jgi:hypothetical protein